MSLSFAASSARHAAPTELLKEAQAQSALADLFPHLKTDALRAIQDLFPLRAQMGVQTQALAQELAQASLSPRTRPFAWH